MKKTFTFLVVTLITLLLSGCQLFINTNPVESEEYLEELCDITVHSFESKKMTIKYTFDIHFGEEKEEVTSEIGYDYSGEEKYEFSKKNAVVIFVKDGDKEYDFRDMSMVEIDNSSFTDPNKYRDNFLNMIREASKTAIKEVKEDMVIFSQTDMTGITYQYEVKDDKLNKISIRVNDYLKTNITFEYDCKAIAFDIEGFE